ncbi:MAG: GTPase [Bacteroidota bacterium]
MTHQNAYKLLFIYNANSGLRNTLLDGAHKILSPSTYACSLCDLTYGALTEKKVWKQFRTANKMQMEFLHKDEFSRQYASKFGYKFTFPIILIATPNALEVFVTPEEINALEKAEDLIAVIQKRSK